MCSLCLVITDEIFNTSVTRMFGIIKAFAMVTQQFVHRGLKTPLGAEMTAEDVNLNGNPCQCAAPL